MIKRGLFKGLYKLCQCGCKTLIPLINKRGEFARYKNRHYTKRERHPFYKGGISYSDKYVTILRPHHKYAYGNRRVQLHRYRMELMLGRYLRKNEVVHHIDKDTNNNDEFNLMLFENHSLHVSYEQKKDMRNRYCLLCNGKTRINERGGEQWSVYQNGFICNRCYLKQWRDRRYCS